MKSNSYKLIILSMIFIASIASSCNRHVVTADYRKPHHYPHPHEHTQARTDIVIKP